MTIKSLYEYFAHNPNGNWIVEPQNASFLYSLIKKNPNIKRVLDLGTGIGLSASTAALAMEGRDYHIDSLEQYDKCIKIAKDLIPKEFKVNIIKSEAVLWTTKYMPHISMSIYKDIPSWDYDLILNDGPGPWQEGDNWIDLNNGTIQKATIEEKIKPGTLIAYDGRISSIKTIERYFSDNFYIVKTAYNKFDDFNVLEKKDVPFSFCDTQLKLMEERGYFSEPKTVKEPKKQESLSPKEPAPQ